MKTYRPAAGNTMDAVSIRLNEIKMISEMALDQTSQIFTQALDMTQQELAGAMKVWLEAPLEQKLDERESLAVGYLTTFFLHSKLCDAVAGGNIIDIVEAVGEFQTVLFRLAGAGLVIDPKAITGRAIADTLKQIPRKAQEANKLKGDINREKIIPRYKEIKRMFPKKKDADIADMIMNELRIEAVGSSSDYAKLLKKNKKNIQNLIAANK